MKSATLWASIILGIMLMCCALNCGVVTLNDSDLAGDSGVGDSEEIRSTVNVADGSLADRVAVETSAPDTIPGISCTTRCAQWCADPTHPDLIGCACYCHANP